MGFTRFIQNGRVCLVNYGDHDSKLVVVVDVIDQNRCLVYGPSSGVSRQVIGYKRLSLTDIKIDIGRGAKAKHVDMVYKKEDVDSQWAATSWGKKLAARKAKASANDFDRFKQPQQTKQRVIHAIDATHTNNTVVIFDAARDSLVCISLSASGSSGLRPSGSKSRSPGV